MVSDQPAGSRRAAERGGALGTQAGVMNREGQPIPPRRRGHARKLGQHAGGKTPEQDASDAMGKPDGARRACLAKIVEEAGRENLLVLNSFGL